MFKTNTGKKKRFVEKLKDEYGVSEEDLKYYRFCGKYVTDMHRNPYIPDTYLENYFKNIEWTKEMITELHSTAECVCGQNITNLYFITDTRSSQPEILVLGSDCINSFTIFGKKKFCITCNAEHKNRIYNQCNSCLTHCNCGGIKKKGYDKCKQCLSKICECGRPKKSEYKTCWNCKPKFNCLICNKIMYKDYKTCWDCKSGNWPKEIYLL
tara:strand:- start:112 stop:744 length:633 start_codon:yes stop_codon:yes gene_type:complete